MAEITVTDREGGVHRVNAREGVSLMETLRELDYGVAAICGGMCSCATCHVYVAEPWPERLPRFSDYAHLARVAEWSDAEAGS